MDAQILALTMTDPTVNLVQVLSFLLLFLLARRTFFHLFKTKERRIHKRQQALWVTAAALAVLLGPGALARAQEAPIPDKPDLKVYEVDISANAMVLEYGIVNEGSDFEGRFNVNIYYKIGEEGEYSLLYTDVIDTSDPDIDLSHLGTCYRNLTDVEWKWGWPKFFVEARIDEEGTLDEADTANNSKEGEWTYLELIPKRMGYFISFPLIIILLGTGLLITISNKFLQARKLGHSFKVVAGAYDDPKDEGDVTHFQALSAALSATVGIGNIAGVAIALRWGGPVGNRGFGDVPEICRMLAGPSLSDYPRRWFRFRRPDVLYNRRAGQKLEMAGHIICDLRYFVFFLHRQYEPGQHHRRFIT